jgi:hypothetical protein
MASDLEPLDLADIAVLLLYEWATLDPRFRHTKLVEVAYPGRKLQSYPDFLPIDDSISNRTWIILKRKEGGQHDRDLATNMVDNDINHALSNEQLDTIFYQTRTFSFCCPAVTLLQHFFDQFPPDTKLCVRLGPVNKRPGESYVTSISRRTILRTKLIHPTTQTLIDISGPAPMESYNIRDEMIHSIMLFRSAENDKVKHTSALDLSSMQFGELGRGPGAKGKMPFALDTRDEFNARHARLAMASVVVGVSKRIGFSDWPDDAAAEEREYGLAALPPSALLVDIARRVKERWENRDKEKWCGYCGAPGPKSRCSGCREVWFCGKEHQTMAWSFHKGYCRKD